MIKFRNSSKLSLGLAVILSLSMSSVMAEDEKRGSFLNPDVDEPPEEIYVPLHGIGSEINGSTEIEESRKLREEAATRGPRLTDPEYLKKLQKIDDEVPIADGTQLPKDLKAGQQAEAATVYRQPDGSLTISE